MLHLLGLDHEKLTYRHAGRDYRLTDVYGRVVQEVLAWLSRFAPRTRRSSRWVCGARGDHEQSPPKKRQAEQGAGRTERAGFPLSGERRHI